MEAAAQKIFHNPLYPVILSGEGMHHDLEYSFTIFTHFKSYPFFRRDREIQARKLQQLKKDMEIISNRSSDTIHDSNRKNLKLIEADFMAHAAELFKIVSQQALSTYANQRMTVTFALKFDKDQNVHGEVEGKASVSSGKTIHYARINEGQLRLGID